jgi:ribosomal protein S1
MRFFYSDVKASTKVFTGATKRSETELFGDSAIGQVLHSILNGFDTFGIFVGNLEGLVV